MDAVALQTAVENAINAHGKILDSDREVILAEALKGGITPQEIADVHAMMRASRRDYAKAVQAFTAAERDLARAYNLVPPSAASLESARKDRETALLKQEDAALRYEAYELIDADWNANKSLRPSFLATNPAHEPAISQAEYDALVRGAREVLSDAIDVQDAAEHAVAEAKEALAKLSAPSATATMDDALAYRASEFAVAKAEREATAAGQRVDQLAKIVERLTKNPR